MHSGVKQRTREQPGLKCGEVGRKRPPTMAGGAASATARTGFAAHTHLHRPSDQQLNETACRRRGGCTVAGSNERAAEVRRGRAQAAPYDGGRGVNRYGAHGAHSPHAAAAGGRLSAKRKGGGGHVRGCSRETLRCSEAHCEGVGARRSARAQGGVAMAGRAAASFGLCRCVLLLR